jgi:hypothetical protein
LALIGSGVQDETDDSAFLVSAALLSAGSAEAALVSLQNATATFSQVGFTAANAIDGNAATTGWAIDPNEVGQTAVFETSSDLFTSGGTLTFSLSQLFGQQHNIGRFALFATTDNRSMFAGGLQSGGDVTANWTPRRRDADETR